MFSYQCYKLFIRDLLQAWDAFKYNTPGFDLLISKFYFCFRYSFGQLPVWAKKELDVNEAGSGLGRTPAGPRGRWAQRVGQSGLTIKSVLDDQAILPRGKKGYYYKLQFILLLLS